jgi:hypothetical protein
LGQELGGVRPQVAPLGEPSRIVALVREGHLEQRRRGRVVEGPKAPITQVADSAASTEFELRGRGSCLSA